MQQLGATGNTYDIQIEAKILDDNSRRATTTSNDSLIGEHQYYSVYTNTILDKMEANENREYQLKNDDYIIVTVKNTNITLGTQLKNFLYNLIGKDTYTIGTTSSALVLNGGQTQVHPGTTIASIPTTPTPEPEPEPEPAPEPAPEPTPEPDEYVTLHYATDPINFTFDGYVNGVHLVFVGRKVLGESYLEL